MVTETKPRNSTDLKGDGRLFEMCVQGFDINAEDAMLLLGLTSSSSSVKAEDAEDAIEAVLFGGVGGAVVSPEALRALAEGFEAVAGTDVIPAMCAGQDADQGRTLFSHAVRLTSLPIILVYVPYHLSRDNGILQDRQII